MLCRPETERRLPVPEGLVAFLEQQTCGRKLQKTRIGHYDSVTVGGRWRVRAGHCQLRFSGAGLWKEMALGVCWAPTSSDADPEHQEPRAGARRGQGSCTEQKGSERIWGGGSRGRGQVAEGRPWLNTGRVDVLYENVFIQLMKRIFSQLFFLKYIEYIFFGGQLPSAP